jgi:hypothetical protein
MDEYNYDEAPVDGEYNYDDGPVGGYDGEEIAEEPEEPEEYDVEEALEENDDYGDDGEGELRNEFGAFDRAGHLRVFAETEEDQFFNNMELYAYRNGISKNMEDIRREFAVLARNYPHPRCLSPGACFIMNDYLNRAGLYVWNADKYDENKSRGVTRYTVIRYIAIFNKYNR